MVRKSVRSVQQVKRLWWEALSLEWKREVVRDGKSGDEGDDELM